jgi:hypothetical protein
MLEQSFSALPAISVVGYWPFFLSANQEGAGRDDRDCWLRKKLALESQRVCFLSDAAKRAAPYTAQRFIMHEETVTTVDELVAATADASTKRIVVSGNLTDAPLIKLQPGQSLQGTDSNASITFCSGADGVQLSTDSSLGRLRLNVSPDRRAIFNDTRVLSLGRLELRDVTAVGRVQILARDRVRGGHVDVEGVDIVAADARSELERPRGYGVSVLHGAFTLWNQQADTDVAITADIAGISAGRDGAPVRGSGIFVSGCGDDGGRLVIRRLETGAVYSDGGIAPGTPDCISGGVFVVFGAFADRVRCRGPVTTYGANDMVLDNWGTVDRWIADQKITSYGQSGIGFVDFGTINCLEVNEPIETFGQGARGFNVYTGTVHRAEFERIVTHADGAVGIQISQPVGKIKVRRGIETFGGTGKSLVKGVVTELSAIAFSVKPGGSARAIDIAGGAVTHGAGVSPFEFQGAIEGLQVSGNVVADGGGFAKTAG